VRVKQNFGRNFLGAAVLTASNKGILANYTTRFKRPVFQSRFICAEF